MGDFKPTRYKFRFTGITPLIMHHDNVDASDDLSAWRKDPENKKSSVAGDDRSPAWTWMTYLYTNGESVAFPSENIMAMIMQAATEISLKGNKTYKELSQAGILIEQEYCDFSTNGVTIPMDKIEKMKSKSFKEQLSSCLKLGFRLFVKRAGVNGKKHVRVRPRFDKWEICGTIMTLNELVDKELKRILLIAGDHKGLGDWRPASPKRPGPYGRFDVELKAI